MWECRDCGSRNIVLECFVFQNPETGEREIGDVCDKGHICNESGCGSENVRWVEKEAA